VIVRALVGLAMVAAATSCSWGSADDEEAPRSETTRTTAPLLTEHVVTPQFDYVASGGRVVASRASRLALEVAGDGPSGVALLVFPLAPGDQRCVESVELDMAAISGSAAPLTAYPAVPLPATAPADGARAGVGGVLLLGNRPAADAVFAPDERASLDLTDHYRAWVDNEWPGGTPAFIRPGTPFRVALRPANVSAHTDLVLASSESSEPPRLIFRTDVRCARATP
jgi:hypothetical protein